MGVSKRANTYGTPGELESIVISEMPIATNTKSLIRLASTNEMGFVEETVGQMVVHSGLVEGRGWGRVKALIYSVYQFPGCNK